jgi:FdhD protein
MIKEASGTWPVIRYANGQRELERPDQLAAEEPLEIRVEGHSVAVVMRTPGLDRELAAGFLLTESLVRSAADIFDITQCGGEEGQVVNVTLKDPTAFDPAKLTRNVFSSSSCGVCSKATIDAVRQSFPAIDSACSVRAETVLGMPAALRTKQETFNQTGGLHACALFDLDGNLEHVREDVGRHNALDKLIGHALLANELPLRDRVLLLSGRVSFEMMQKALAAGVPIVAAISAPTTLAVQFARESNQTLIGFLRGETMNIYAGAERLRSTRIHAPDHLQTNNLQ